MFDYADNTGETWPHPYWISAGGWVLRPFWDHYLVTGDLDFLRKRMVPAYKDLALFYEDFLTVTDKNGNYIFVPSFSPENNPGNLNPGCMAVINASMDISVCREVLANLVEACELLGIEADSIPKWKAMLAMAIRSTKSGINWMADTLTQAGFNRLKQNTKNPFMKFPTRDCSVRSLCR